ncbi:MAG: threonine--tRNA ligase, partial [Deltaproteobacteria bacterium]|nr:threonine--tRNA ligase [Candidatus Tharpella aukensis]
MFTLQLSEKSPILSLDADGKTLFEHIVEQDTSRLRDVVAARIGGNLVDLQSVPADGDEVFLVEKDSEAGLEVLRHSAAHIMAEAVQMLFPDAKVTIGPAIKDGFYYDFDIENPFTPEDLRAIEKQMKTMIKKGRNFVRREVGRQEAIDLFTGMGEEYNVELINDLREGETLSLYQSGDFVDLCRGPHLPNASYLKG